MAARGHVATTPRRNHPQVPGDHGQLVAAATAQRFFLADELRNRRPGDPETVFICYMCAYAREILTAGLPGPYSERQARRFAQAA